MPGTVWQFSHVDFILTRVIRYRIILILVGITIIIVVVVVAFDIMLTLCHFTYFSF